MKRKEKREQISPAMTVTRQQLAAMLGVTLNQITKWTERGMPVAVVGGGRGHPSQYDVSAVLAWWRREILGQTDTPKDRYYSEQADKAALLNRKLRGELGEMAIVRQRNAEKVVACKERLLSYVGNLVQRGWLSADYETPALDLLYEALSELNGMDADPLPRKTKEQAA